MINNELEIKIQNLPQLPGIYQFKDATGKVIYVGKAKNLRNRVRSYFVKSQPPNPKLTALVSKIHDIEVIVTSSEVEALILEANLIKKLKPRYNVNLKDDKSYPYIAITNEPFPRVFSTRASILPFISWTTCSIILLYSSFETRPSHGPPHFFI